MNAYLWTLLVLFSISIVSRICRLVYSDFSSKPGHVGFELAVDAGLLAWTAVLLLGA